MSASNKPTRVTPSRAVIKISGAGFGGADPLEPDAIGYILDQVKQAREGGTEIALVVGGGNIIRGREQELLSRTAGDLAGMVGTTVNGIVLKDQLQSMNVPVLLQSALPIDRVTDPVDPDRADAHLRDGGIVVFVGGTGNPYFTTDSAAALRAGEIGADLILKGTNVRGVFTGDPSEEDAEFLPELTYERLVEQELGIIDVAAAKICRETEIPMVIFNLFDDGATARALKGGEIGTYVYPEK
ncbi:UMP kinase [Candidatus Bipolaricaulota bacterium]|nr:UMP kinase [Candidatus Bipolaricaulota bacterium]